MTTPSISTEQEARCPRCGAKVAGAAKYCAVCGAAQQAPMPTPAAGNEEEPWGPFKLRWRGRYMRPEMASLLLVFAVVASASVVLLIARSLREGGHGSSGARPVEQPALPYVPPQITDKPSPAQKRMLPKAETPSARAESSATLPTEREPTRVVPEAGGTKPKKGGAVPSGGPPTQPPTQPLPAAPEALPSIVTFGAEAPSIQKGSDTTLRWSVTGHATQIRIEPGFEDLPLQGSRQVQPDATTQYTLFAAGPGGTSKSSLKVSVVPIPLPLGTLAADVVSLPAGQATTLRWNVQNATHVSISPLYDSANMFGAVSIKPAVTTRYILQAEGPGGTWSKTVVVSVVAPLGPTSGQLVWTGVVRGTTLVTIDKDHADLGTLEGALPGVQCIVQPTNERRVAIASTPSPSNNYQRLVLRVTGNGMIRAVINWSLQ